MKRFLTIFATLEMILVVVFIFTFCSMLLYNLNIRDIPEPPIKDVSIPLGTHYEIPYELSTSVIKPEQYKQFGGR